MKFKKDDLLETVCNCIGELYTLDDGTYTTMLWQKVREGKHDCTDVDVVFSHHVEGEVKYYAFSYSRRYSEGIESEYWYNEIECPEMEPVEVTAIQYIPKKASK